MSTKLFPRQPSGEGGWTIQIEFLEKVFKKNRVEFVSLEAIEEILLAAEEVGLG